jgi:hypothetical protein
LSEEGYRVADTRPKIQNSRAFDVQFSGKTSQLSDLVGCEIFGALAADCDIGPMKDFIFLSELIKFSTIHISLLALERLTLTPNEINDRLLVRQRFARQAATTSTEPLSRSRLFMLRVGVA